MYTVHVGELHLCIQIRDFSSNVQAVLVPYCFIQNTVQWAYFGYLDQRVTFRLLACLAGTPKLGLAPLPNPLRVGHTTIIVG